MKLSIDRAALLSALHTVAPAVPHKSTLPITRCVLIEHSPGTYTGHRATDRLSLRCTNLDITITATAYGTVKGATPLAVPLDILEDYLAAVQGDRVTLAVGGEHSVKVTCGRNTARISTMPADDFPPAPVVPDGNELRIDGAILRAAIGRVVFAAAKDDNRPILTGVLWRIEPGSLTLAAADGFRLAVQTIPTEYRGEPANLIVPARATDLISKLVKGDSDVIVRWVPGAVSVEAGGATVTAQQIAGTFPNYVSLIPAEFTSTVRLPLAALSAAVKTAATFAGDSQTIRLIGRDGILMLLSTDAESGDSSGSVDAEVEGEPCRIAMNAKYLAEALSSMPDGATVELLTNTPRSPGVLRVAGETGNTIVIMPQFVPVEAFEVREAVPA